MVSNPDEKEGVGRLNRNCVIVRLGAARVAAWAFSMGI